MWRTPKETMESASAKACGTLLVVPMLISSVLVVSAAYRSANAITFNQMPKTIEGTQGGADAEAPDIAVSKKLATSKRNAYIIWHEAPPTNPNSTIHEVYFSRSVDNGRNFQDRINLSESKDLTSSDEQIAVFDEHVYVVWFELETGEIIFRRSINGGSSFRNVKKLNTEIATGVPEITASGDNVYVVWQGQGPGGDTDIFFAESNDGGRNFSDEDDISENDDESLDPVVAVAGHKVIVTWRDFSTPTGAGFEIFYRQGE